MSSKISHLKTHDSGWWLNKAVDGTGAPRALGLGLVTLAPGATRFVDAKTVARSGGAFANALAAGFISGPFASSAEAAGGVKEPKPAAAVTAPEPVPVEVAPEPAAVEPEPAPVEVAPEPTAVESAPAEVAQELAPVEPESAPVEVASEPVAKSEKKSSSKKR